VIDTSLASKNPPFHLLSIIPLVHTYNTILNWGTGPTNSQEISIPPQIHIEPKPFLVIALPFDRQTVAPRSVREPVNNHLTGKEFMLVRTGGNVFTTARD